MINYTPQNQLSLDLFSHPFETVLDANNRWVRLAELVPWDELAGIYARQLENNSGRKTIDIRIVIAAVIIKHKLRLDDRGTVAMIQENIYLQYFCGLKEFTIAPVFDPSLFVDIRKRLGKREFDKFNQAVILRSEELKPKQSKIKTKSNEKRADKNEETKNKGTLKVDATVADQEITYPNDVKLLNEARENLERIIDKLYNKEDGIAKPRDYRRVARKDFLNFAKKKRKSKKEIRRGVKQQLQYVRRDIKYIEDLLANSFSENKLNKRDVQLWETILNVYDQQNEMYSNNCQSISHRIVNLYQPYVRPIVRGKDKAKTEFGSKIDLSLVDGFARIDRIDWEAYNEGTDVKLILENYYTIYGCYPQKFLADRIYLNRENRKLMSEKGIQHYGKPLGRPPKERSNDAQKRHRNKKEEAKRNQVEGKFGQGKRGYNLNDIKARLAETSISWISAIVFVMNLESLLKLAEKTKGIFMASLEKVTQNPKTVYERNIINKYRTHTRIYYQICA